MKSIKFSSNISRLNTQFKSERSNQNQINNEIDGISRNILDNGMVEELDKPYTHKEVYQAITQLKFMASSGSDGIFVLFYQKNWDIIGLDITGFVLNILNHKGNPKDYNQTHIYLIPKNNNHTSPSEFTHIVLCNVFMKITTKIIANIMEKVLPHMVCNS